MSATGKAGQTEPTVPRSDGPLVHDDEKMKFGQDSVMGDEVVTVCDRVTNVIAVFLLFAVALASIIGIAAGACCLASLAGKEFHHFPLFFAFGVVPLLLGCICLVGAVSVILFISLCAMGLRKYGMCCAGGSCLVRGFRVCLLGIFPFILLLALVAMCILGFTFFSLSQQIPPLDKNYDYVEGISGPVEIIRDEHGMTHIKASSRRDAYFGQGFAEAQDRLFQIELHRLAGKGKLSARVGADGLATDKNTRTLNIRKAARALCRSASPEEVEYMQAFADGINLFMKRESKRPVEFFFMSTRPLFFYNPDPFTVEDMCIAARLLQFQMSSNMYSEGTRFSVWANSNRTYAEVEELFRNFDSDDNTILSNEQIIPFLGVNVNDQEEVTKAMKTNAEKKLISRIQEGLIYDVLFAQVRAGLQNKLSPPAKSSAEAPQESLHFSMQRVMENTFHTSPVNLFANKYIHASNAWAARSASGRPMAASDPHLTVTLPSVWYYTHLSFPASDGTPYDVAGVCIVGLPGVHIGKSTFVAWGITMSLTDLEDIFVLPPSSITDLPEDQYIYKGEVHTVVKRRERIQVRGKKDVVMDLEDTVFGPVVSELFGFPPGLKAALYAVPLRNDDTSSISALIGLSDPKIKTAEALMNNLLKLQSPGFSIPIADVKGNIAYVMTGKHPLRDSGHTGKYPTLTMDKAGLVESVCSLIQGVGVGKCNYTTLAQTDPGVVTQFPPELIKRIVMEFIKSWTSYPSGDPDVPDTYIEMKKFNPHVHIPFDNNAAHISAANQKVVGEGYPYLFGGDYAAPYRGAYIQTQLAGAADLSQAEFHSNLQLDMQSNIWVTDFKPLFESPQFTDLLKGDEATEKWVQNLRNWDSKAVIGSVPAAFFWRWMQLMAVLPRDAVAITGKLWSVESGYTARMLKSPTSLMKKECASALGQESPGTPSSCLEFAAKMFKDLVAKGDFSEQWGINMNHLVANHEMLLGKPIHPLYQREISKGGDMSSVCVSGNSINGNMVSVQASSMRQLYDLWNNTDYMYIALPGGNSGNPYSKYFQNLLEKFKKDEYVSVCVTAKSLASLNPSHQQVLSP